MISQNKKLLRLSLVLCLLHVFSVQARNSATIGNTYAATEQNKKPQRQSKEDDWLAFPYTILVSPYLGLTREVPQRLKPSDNSKYWYRLRIMGASLDVGVLQIRKSIWKHFHCYPQLGLVLNYGQLENKGSLTGILLYLEPQYDHLTRWEIFPRMGVGITYANIPGTNFKNLTPEEEEVVKNNDALAEDFYQQGLHLDLSLTLITKIRLTPHWQLSPSVGFSYMPSITNDEPDERKQYRPKDTALRVFSASVGLGYTPNPSLIYYPGMEVSKKSRVDIGLLSAFKKFEPLSRESRSRSQTGQQEEDTDGESKYHYVGGIYGQWSLQLCNSHAITLATEWIHDGAAQQALKDKIKPSALKISLLGGHEFRWGKFMFGQQLGCHLMNNVQEEFPLYARLGLDYRITDSLFVGTSIKILLKKADYFLINSIQQDFIDFRIGYSF